MKLAAFIDLHGGQVETSDELTKYVRDLIRTPPHRLIYRVVECVDGAVAVARMRLAHEDYPGAPGCVWGRLHGLELVE